MSTWPVNAWYVAAWDREVDNQPLARTICGIAMMLYRKLDRGVVAMRDACPHRMLPLSMGLREGDSIRCRYHGLKLGPDGVAEEMPIKSDPVNRHICAETFIVHERHRFVWVWPGDPLQADPALIPDLHWNHDPAWAADGKLIEKRLGNLRRPGSDNDRLVRRMVGPTDRAIADVERDIVIFELI